MMKIILTAVLGSLLLFGACTKMQQGKWSYRRGNYQKAVTIFEDILKTEATNEMAKHYVVLARSGLMADRAAEAVEVENYEEAIGLVDQAIGLDPDNKDAQALLNTCIGKLTKTITKDLVLQGAWQKIVDLSGLILKHRPGNKSMIVTNAKAVFHAQKDRLNAHAILAIQKAYKEVPDNDFLKSKMSLLNETTGDFKRVYEAYRDAILAKNYDKWRSLLTPKHIKEVDVIVKEYIEKNDLVVKNVRDYFTELTKDPAKYESPQGAEIVCIEPLSSNHGFVHFNYNTLPKLLKMEIVSVDGSLKLHREEDSEIKKSDL
jgi:tetratricopeptide (TPR) repeat protein